MKSYILILTYLTCAFLHAQSSKPIGFVEQWVLSQDRAATLKQLVPGTDDYYFFHTLHYQQTGDKVKFQSTMDQWRNGKELDDPFFNNSRFEVMRKRAIILDYERDPKGSIKKLTEILKLRLDHQRPIPPEDANIPSTVDPALISDQAFRKQAATKGKDYEAFCEHLIPEELKKAKTFDRTKRLWFLKELNRADFPEVPQLILAELRERNKPDFASIPCTKHLLLEQLIWLETQHPALRDHASFVSARLTRMRPGDTYYLLHHPEQKLPWLTQSWKYASTLSLKFNSLKAHILHNLLESHRQNDRYPEDLFISYLQLPRITSSNWVQRAKTSNAARLNKDYSSITTLPPIRSDDALIRAYLLHILGKKENAAAYAKLLTKEKLTRIHAEARLLAGADTSLWGKKLTPESFRDLRDRTEVTLAASNIKQWSSTDDVTLQLDLKNSPRLTVRIFEIDALSHIRRTGSDPSVGIKLNGLVPHHQQTIEFKQDSLIRHRHALKLPQLKGHGIWIVECISNGVSCRSLVRKGSLQLVTRNSADGQTATIFDENQAPVHPATLWIKGTSYPTNKNGEITLPLASSSRTERAVIFAPRNGDHADESGLATASQISRISKNYQLKIAAGTDLEQLRAGNTATIFVRPRLSNNGKPVLLSELKNPTLHIAAQLRGDITTELSDLSVKIPESGIITQSISLPEELRSISITLTGEIPRTGEQKPLKLSSSSTVKINGINDTINIAQPLLAYTTKGWHIDLLGRNGEPLPNRILNIEFWRNGFTEEITLPLRTDANGQIHLGQVEGIDSIEMEPNSFSGGLSKNFYTDDFTTPDEIHALAGEEIRLLSPITKSIKDVHALCGIFRHHGDPKILIASMKQHLSSSGNEIVIKNLPAGEYSLVFTDFTAPIPIRMIDGKKHGPWVCDKIQTIEYSNPLPLHILNVKTHADTLTAKVAGNTKNARIVAIGTRYKQNGDHFSLFHFNEPDTLSRWHSAYLGNEFLNGRTLSDEYRYILERRNAKHFPGNMLPRPGLLLNPWTQDESDALFSEGGGAFGGVPMSMKKRGKKGESDNLAHSPPSADTSPSFDFLAHSSVIKTDLKLAADGTISLPLKDFAHCQSITLLAITDQKTAGRTVPLSLKKLDTRERRLDRNLDPKKHYTGTQGTAVLSKGATAEIKNVLDADWKAYTSLGHIYDYFHANNGDEHLREFVHLMQWPTLTDKQRLGAAQLLASHEFHLFAYLKDRKWFDTNIKPILSQKRHRSFIDNFLLGKDLTTYLNAWQYQRLNAAEKALLARALPAHKEAIVQDLRQRYEIIKPTPEHETLLFTSALKQNSLALRDRLGFASRDLAVLERAEKSSAGVQYVQQKLNNIIIPLVDFENTTVAEAIDFLRLRTRELDPEPDQSFKGLNFITRGRGLTEQRIDELKLRNVPLGTLLQYICDKTRTRYRLSGHAIELLPLTALEVNDLYTRTFVVPPDFMASLSENSDDDDDDPFGGGGSTLRQRPSAKELLMNSGISFPDNAFVTYNAATSTIVVHNSQGNLDVIEQIIQPLRSHGPGEKNKRLSTSGYGGRAPMLGAVQEEDESMDDPFGGGDDAFSAGGADALRRKPSEPDDLLTHIWSESHYFRHSNLQAGPVIKPNKFWIDFAEHDGKTPFLSARFTECAESTASMLIALAVLDLPFKGEKPEATIDRFTLKVQAKSPMLLFYRDTRETDKVADSTPLLVRQNFFRHGDRTRTDAQGRRVENTVSGAFLAGVPYDSSFIITNPTGTPRELQILTQIPRGSIPLSGDPATDSRKINIKAHGTTRVEFSFYFPTAGTYPHFPAHVLEDGIVQASAENSAIKVLAEAEKRDTRSWNAVARDGTDTEVLTRLATENLERTSLKPILWRLAKPDFYQQLVNLLNRRLHFDPEVLAYGFKHGDETAVITYLENHPLTDEIGAYLDAKLLKLDNRKRGHWEHLEFDPLVNPRQHKFQGHRLILNQQVKDQYLTILDSIAWKPAPTQDDLLTLTYHLFLQDRIGEALDYFNRIKRDQVVTQMQYDYLHCYALFYQEKPAEAATIAARWKDSKNTRWARRFQAVTTQAKEIASRSATGKPQPGDAKKAAVHVPKSLSIEPANGRLAIHYTGITKSTLRLYAVDLEVLFSENPFLDKQGDINPSIKPNKIIQIKLPEGQKQHTIDLPEKLSYGNVLAMIESGGLRKVLALDSNALQVNRRISDKSLSITRSSDGAPLPRCYVKIYIEKTDGKTEFYKDGYTDLRGMFPYQAHTRIAPHQVKRYAIFVSHPKLGSKIMTFR